MKRLLLAAVATASFIAPAAAATVVTADRMLDVETGRYIDHPAILIGDDGRIQSIGSLAALQVPAGTKHIDLPGKTLLPGLIDMHVHLTSLAEIGGYQTLKYTDSFWQAVGVANARKTLDAGFTTVRNVGSSDFEDVGLQQAIDGGWIVGPRIVPATYAIGATGGHCDDNSLPPSLDKKGESIIDSPGDARAKVRWLHKYGAEVIKICATGGVFSLGDSVGGQQLSREEMKAIADEAHMYRDMLVEAASEYSDEVLAAALDGKPVPAAQLVSAIRKGTISGKIQPTLDGTSLHNKGFLPVIDGVVVYLPSPLDVPVVAGKEPETDKPLTRDVKKEKTLA
jgi:imidazolonepropionase-like amidohydrolase